MLICQRCGCSDVKLILTPKGPHYGKRVCSRCGRFVKWESRPRRDWRGLILPPSRPHGMCVGLIGKSQDQVSFGEASRSALMARVRAAGRDYAPLIGAMSNIADATWWIANRERAVDEITWPAEWPSKQRATG